MRNYLGRKLQHFINMLLIPHPKVGIGKTEVILRVAGWIPFLTVAGWIPFLSLVGDEIPFLILAGGGLPLLRHLLKPFDH